jgi:hypothetical protein
MRYLAWALVVLAGCKCHSKMAEKKQVESTSFKPDFASGPPAIIYKTRADYTDKVPVILSDDKLRIVSYPDPSDLQNVNGYPIPTKLKAGYLLDNRGIGKNVAFLSITYNEYAGMIKSPSIQELYSKIIDKEPLIELCNCGNRKAFKDEVTQINQLIDSKKIRTICNAIK